MRGYETAPLGPHACLRGKVSLDASEFAQLRGSTFILMLVNGQKNKYSAEIKYNHCNYLILKFGINYQNIVSACAHEPIALFGLYKIWLLA